MHQTQQTESDFQQQCRGFVDREIFCNASELIEALGRIRTYSDEITEISLKPQYLHTFKYECNNGHEWEKEEDEPRNEEIPNAAYLSREDYERLMAPCPECKDKQGPDDIGCEEIEGLEALEHWIISERLARQLRQRGEMVGKICGLWIWGRTCSGQGILLDEVIRDIVKTNRW